MSTIVLLMELETKNSKLDIEVEYDCNPEDIKSYMQLFEEDGTLATDKCRITHEFDGQLTVKGTKEELQKQLFKRKSKQSGFIKTEKEEE